MLAQKRFKPDRGLQVRMLFTMLLLTALYLIFSFVLFRFTHLGLFVFIIPLAGLFFQYYFSDKLVLASTGSHVVTEAQAPQLYGIVQRLAQQSGLPVPRVAIMQSSMPNAFATGRSPKHAVVTVTTGLLNILDPAQLEAVLGHEMTHIRNRDMVVMTMAGSVAAVAAWIVQMGFWLGIGDRRDNQNGGFAVMLLVSLLVQVVAHILVLTLSRYREYAADRGGALLTGAPEQLASALLAISGSMNRVPTQDLREAQPMSAMFIAAPRRQLVAELFSDHPPVEKRIARLQALERQMAIR